MDELSSITLLTAGGETEISENSPTEKMATALQPCPTTLQGSSNSPENTEVQGEVKGLCKAGLRLCV